jgi:hypothetical protein
MSGELVFLMLAVIGAFGLKMGENMRAESDKLRRGKP